MGPWEMDGVRVGLGLRVGGEREWAVGGGWKEESEREEIGERGTEEEGERERGGGRRWWRKERERGRDGWKVRGRKWWG